MDKMAKQHWDYFDHDADIGIIGRGHTLTAAFERAAYAMFSLMANLDNTLCKQSVTIDFEESDHELALVRWLNALLTAAQIKHLILCDFHLEHRHNHWHGTASGDGWSPTDSARGVEVKGATLTALSVRPTVNAWEARCIVDL